MLRLLSVAAGARLTVDVGFFIDNDDDLAGRGDVAIEGFGLSVFWGLLVLTDVFDLDVVNCSCRDLFLLPFEYERFWLPMS